MGRLDDHGCHLLPASAPCIRTQKKKGATRGEDDDEDTEEESVEFEDYPAVVVELVRKNKKIKLKTEEDEEISSMIETQLEFVSSELYSHRKHDEESVVRRSQ